MEIDNVLAYCKEHSIVLDTIFIIAKTNEINDFHTKFHDIATRHRKYCIFSNDAQFGYSGFFSPLDKQYFDKKNLEQYRYPECTNDNSICLLMTPNESTIFICNLELYNKSEFQPTKLADQYSNIKIINKIRADDKK
jgi:hypothetical protein